MAVAIHQVFPEDYQTQLTEKTRLTEQEFAAFDPPDLDVFPSPPTHYRMRAEFKIWQSGGVAAYAMYTPGEYKKPYTIDAFPVASRKINALMPQVLAFINRYDLMRRRLFQVQFLSATTGDTVVTLIYHKPLDDEWLELAESLRTQLNINLIGRSRKQKAVLGRDYVEERFKVRGTEYRYRQVEGAFSQPNGQVCEKMLNWAATVVEPLAGDLLELYCGNGNFTIPLAARFEQVLATEIAKSSVSTAKHNLAANGIDNVEIVRLSSEELTQAIQGVRPFRRLSHIDLAAYAFSTVFVDPPRAGLDPATLDLVRTFDNILYISCNPQTLRENVCSLADSHRITRMALFDQFPYSHHRECGLLLRKR